MKDNSLELEQTVQNKEYISIKVLMRKFKKSALTARFNFAFNRLFRMSKRKVQWY